MKQAKKRKTSRLTQRQWLNVMIIVISAMFLLMVVIGKIMNPDEPSPEKVKDSYHLERLDFGSVQIQLVEQQWRAQGITLNPQQAAKTAQRWQRLLTSPVEAKLNLPSQGKTVLLYIHGIKQPIICKIGLIDQHMIISFIESGHQFKIPEAEMSLYYPEPN